MESLDFINLQIEELTIAACRSRAEIDNATQIFLDNCVEIQFDLSFENIIRSCK